MVANTISKYFVLTETPEFIVIIGMLWCYLGEKLCQNLNFSDSVEPM